MAASACVATAASAASEGRPLRAVTTLDCPASQGALTRIAQAADGRSCDYQGAKGETVRLTLVSLQGRTASEAMAPVKAELYGLVPVYNEPIKAAELDQPGERADIDLPFIHVHTKGDRADVKLFGIRIRSEGETTDVDVGRGRKTAIVRVGGKGAQVTAEEIGRTNASLVSVLAADRRAPSGYRTVGYVAKGPAKGPLVVGEFRSIQKRSRSRDGDHGDVGRLIDRNVKG